MAHSRYIGCTGDASLSEAISEVCFGDKMLYYDVELHKSTFYDQVSRLAENLGLDLLDAYLCDVAFSDDIEHALSYVNDEELLEQMKVFCLYIERQRNVEQTLCNLLKRAVVIQERPEIASLEEKLSREFMASVITINDVVAALIERIESNQCI